MQPAQDITVGGRLARTQYQYTLQDADPNELERLGAEVFWRKSVRTLHQVRDVTTDQQNAGTTATLKIDRDAAARFGIQPQQIDDTLYDAFGQRQVVQYFTQLNSYWVVLGRAARDLEGDVGTLRDLYVRAHDRYRRAACRHAGAHWSTDPITPLAVNHQSAVSRRHHQLQHGANGRIARRCGEGHHSRALNQQLGVPPARCRVRSRAMRRRSRARWPRSPI